MADDDIAVIEYKRGIAVDRQGYFVAAFEWPANGPRPRLNPKGTLEKDKLIWLTLPEALADPQPNGKWDADNLVWLLPDTPAYEVLQRPDKPNFWTLQGSKNVWPEKLPDLPSGRKWILTPPPQTRSQRPVWSDSAGEWKLPQRRMIVDAEGFCINLLGTMEDDADLPIPAGGRAVDPEAITVSDELENERPLQRGDKLNPDNTVAEARKPRYGKVPVRLIKRILTNRGILADFETFLQGKGFEVSDFDQLQVVGLNNKLLREFVVAQGFTLQQAYNLVQRAAENLLEQERQKLQEMAEEV